MITSSSIRINLTFTRVTFLLDIRTLTKVSLCSSPYTPGSDEASEERDVSPAVRWRSHARSEDELAQMGATN